MTQRFQKAYDSLVRAFFEGTLAKGTCVACACGNIIFDAMGNPVTKKDLEDAINIAINLPKVQNEPMYSMARRKTLIAGSTWAAKREPIGELKKIIFKPYELFADERNEAGYTCREFAQIETAFEQNTNISFNNYPWSKEEDILEDQYKGLCAVVDVLLELDEEDSSHADSYKSKFREHPKLQTV